MDHQKQQWKEDPMVKYRIQISQAAVILLLFCSRPTYPLLFVIGFLIAFLGEALRSWACGHIHKDRKLSQEGPYALVRHPLYLGSSLMALGFCISVVNIHFWARTLLLWIVSGFGFFWMYRNKVTAEEAHLENVFPQEYSHYKKMVPALLPDPKTWFNSINTSQFSWSNFVKNKEYHTWVGLLTIWVLLRFKLIYQM